MWPISVRQAADDTPSAAAAGAAPAVEEEAAEGVQDLPHAALQRHEEVPGVRQRLPDAGEHGRQAHAHERLERCV